MILSDKTLLKMLDEKSLIIEPIEKEQIQPASVDIRLGNTFSIVEDSSIGIINLENEIKYKIITSDTYILLPNQFVLATTMEYFDLPNNRRAGIVDVPGHEKFIKNMLAGASGIDIVLLVVAADEGVMPQTVEHLDILSFLNIKNGIVVLTKSDTVDDEFRELV